MKHGMRLSNTLADPSYGTYLQLGLARVPNIVVVRGDSTVEKVWVGRLDQSKWDSILRILASGKRRFLRRSQCWHTFNGLRVGLPKRSPRL
jgi:hypothetical protein